MNSIYGKTVTRQPDHEFKFYTEKQLMRCAYDDVVLDYHQIDNKQYCVQ